LALALELAMDVEVDAAEEGKKTFKFDNHFSSWWSKHARIGDGIVVGFPKKFRCQRGTLEQGPSR
jgi:hypothetical protein